MSEFRRTFFSKNLENSKNNEKNVIFTSKQINHTSGIQLITTIERPLFNDSEDLQKNTNLHEKYNLLERKYDNLINNLKKRNNLLMKAEEIEIAKFKTIIPVLKNEDFFISESNVLIPKENMKKWNLKNEELNIDLCDIRISLINPKCEEINYDFIENDTLLPMHIKIKNIGKDEISLQRYEINLQQSYYVKKFIV